MIKKYVSRHLSDILLRQLIASPCSLVIIQTFSINAILPVPKGFLNWMYKDQSRCHEEDAVAQLSARDRIGHIEHAEAATRLDLRRRVAAGWLFSSGRQ
jgi:hypothetical protein